MADRMETDENLYDDEFHGMMVEDGYNKIAEENERAKKRAQERSKGTIREFWMKPEEKDVPIRYLVEEPLPFYRHNEWVDGKWQKFTCRNGDEIIPGKCPMCDAKWSRSMKAAYLVLDRRVFSSAKSGDKYTNEVKYFALSRNQADHVEDRKKKFGTLLQEWTVNRNGESTNTMYLHDPVDKMRKLNKEEIEKIKSVLIEFKEEWTAYEKKTGIKISIERFVVAKCLRALKQDVMQAIVDDKEAYEARKKKKAEASKDPDGLDNDDPYTKAGSEEEYSFA